MKKLFFHLAAALLLATYSHECNAQPFSKEFEHNDGTPMESGNCAVQSRDGKYVASFGDNTDITVTKMDAWGTVSWTKTLNNMFCQVGSLRKRPSIVTNGNNDVMVIGVSQDANLNNTVGWTLLDGSTGNVIYSGGYPVSGLREVYPVDVIYTSDGGYAIVGQTFDPTFPSIPTRNHFLLRLDAAGNEVYMKIYTNFQAMAQTTTGFTSIIEAMNGDFIIAGSVIDLAVASSSQPFITRTDPNGNVIWQKVYTPLNAMTEAANDLIESKDGSIIFCCRRNELIKIDANGNLIWSKIVTSDNKQWEFDSMAKIEYSQEGMVDEAIVTGVVKDQFGVAVPAWLIFRQTDGANTSIHSYPTGSLGVSPYTVSSAFACQDNGYLMMSYQPFSQRPVLLKTNIAGYIAEKCSREIAVSMVEDNVWADDVYYTTYSNYRYSPTAIAQQDDCQVVNQCCPNPATINAFIDWSNSNCATGTFQLDISMSGGTGPFTYFWFPSGDLNNPNIPNPISTPSAPTYYTVYVTDQNSTCVSTGNVYVEPGCRGANPAANNTKSPVVTEIYPNPADGFLQFETTAQLFTLSVRNMLGENVFTRTDLLAGKYQFDLSSLGAGIYMVEIRLPDGKTYFQKLVLK